MMKKSTWLNAALLGSAMTLGLAGGASAQAIKFSYPVAKTSTMGQTVDHFGALIEKSTNGALKVRGFPDAQLGNEIQSASSAQGGIVEMAVTTTAALASTVKDFDLFQLPFQFPTYQELDTVLRGKTARTMLDKLSASNLIGLCYWDYGFRNVTNNKRPIEKLEDMSGLRIRTIQNAVYLDVLKALGMNPTPLPFPKTFTAIETGAIDGNEVANDVTRATSFYEVQKYLTETRHFPTSSVVLVSKRFWDKLDTQKQDAMRAACDEAAIFNRKAIEASDVDTRKFLTDKGMQINKISDENMQKVREAVKPVIERVTAGLDQEVVKSFNAERDAAKAKSQ